MRTANGRPYTGIFANQLTLPAYLLLVVLVHRGTVLLCTGRTQGDGSLVYGAYLPTYLLLVWFFRTARSMNIRSWLMT